MALTVKSQTGKPTPKTVLLLGLGYCARALIGPLRARGYKIIATRRRVDEESIAGVTLLPFDGTMTDDMRKALSVTNILISSIPPQVRGRGHDQIKIQLKAVDPFLDALSTSLMDVAPCLEWAGYLSATSVYGDRNGQWVFEDELINPITQRGKNRADAEIAWLETGAAVHVFRLAGIYGPPILGMARNPFQRLQSGKARAVIKPGHIVNRIHVEDIASAVLASIDAPNPITIYNVADGFPSPPQDVLNFAADLIGSERPPKVSVNDPKVSDMARSFYGECKRISASKLTTDLAWTPKYSNYRTGLMSIFKAVQGDHRRVYVSGYFDVPDEDIVPVKAALGEHIALSRQEVDCVRFDVWQSEEAPNIFHVFEVFKDQGGYEAHQNRLSKTLWAEVSRNARRYYDVVGA